jgi:uncharacterized protein (TIGR02300 family)
MAKKADRGTKRTCQNASCGARFYDLARDPITCPICGTVYELALSQQALGAASGEDKPARRASKKPEFVAPAAVADLPEAASEDALAEAAEGEEAIAADDDETFLEEEEEDGGDVSGIIGGPVGEEGEEP